MSRDSPYSDWRVVVLKHVVGILESVTPRSLKSAFTQLFLTISPNVPVDLRKGLGEKVPKYLCLVSFALATFFCLIVTGVLCLIEGTLFGTDTSRRYCLQDGWNIFLYALVCPTYVALACWLITLTISKWSFLADYADEKTSLEPRARSPHRLYGVFFVVFLLCAVFITNFVYDIMNMTRQDLDRARIYWFARALSDGTLTLNRAGYYYVALNFSLLFITLLGLAAFLSMAAEVIRAGSAETVDRIDSFEVLHVKLESFTIAYLLAKGLTATYAVNYFVWAVSPLGRTSNLLAAQIGLTIVGVFFIAVPRQYIELKWYELWRTSGKPFEYTETRPTPVKAAASFIDAFFIGSIIVSSWGLESVIAKWLT